jgi:hypothetical protein
MSVNVPMPALGLGLVALSLVVLLVVLRVVLRRKRRAAVEPAPAVVDLSPYTVAEEPEAHEATADVDARLVDVRALRAQVRVLEEALQRAADATVEQPELASYRAQVRVAVQAVARRTPIDTDPRLAVSRVAAAVARLDADPTERVTLPAPLRRPVVVAPVVPEPTVPAPLEQEPEDEVEDEVDEPVVVDVEVVVPVPPPAPAEPRRGRRRSRRSAA